MSASAPAKQSVQVFGRKKTALAIAHCTRGDGTIRLNGYPIETIPNETLRIKALEPVMVAGLDKYSQVSIRIRVRGGGQVAKVYAVRQAIAKALVAYYQKFHDEVAKQELKDTFVKFDRSLIVADPRRREAKKFGGPSARARFQKSYR